MGVDVGGGVYMVGGGGGFSCVRSGKKLYISVFCVLGSF